MIDRPISLARVEKLVVYIKRILNNFENKVFIDRYLGRPTGGSGGKGRGYKDIPI